MCAAIYLSPDKCVYLFNIFNQFVKPWLTIVSFVLKQYNYFDASVIYIVMAFLFVLICYSQCLYFKHNYNKTIKQCKVPV